MGGSLGIIKLIASIFIWIFKAIIWICKKTGIWVMWIVLSALSLAASIEGTITTSPALSQILGIIFIASLVFAGVFMTATTVRSIIRGIKHDPTWTYFKAKQVKSKQHNMTEFADAVAQRKELVEAKEQMEKIGITLHLPPK